jgi:adenine-specific DNA-methyltransferase
MNKNTASPAAAAIPVAANTPTPAAATGTAATTLPPEALSLNLVEQNLAKLRELFPEVVTEGKNGLAANLDVLKQLLGDDQTLTDAEERYGLQWHGKRAARRLALTPSTGTLRPCPQESKLWEKPADWDNSKPFAPTENLYIEGDNLEVLKILQKSYSRKVKLIYIDPPYNTGNDFVYADDFKDNIQNYKELTGQTDSDGNSLTTNKENDGRFHTNWLNMMYPRLKLAQKLLRDDGVIFVSIDDNEQANLKLLMDDVFGERNFVGNFIRKTKSAAKGVPPVNMLVTNHEYIVCYSGGSFIFKGRPRDTSGYSNPDNNPRGPWKPDNMKSTISQKEYPITDPETGNTFTAAWAFAEETIPLKIAKNEIIFPGKKTSWPMQKVFLNEYKNEGIPVLSNLPDDSNFSTTDNASKELERLFDGKDVFSYPKPTDLLNFLIEQAAERDSIILDFFAGSATTAHAVMQINAKDGGKRRFIMVQLPEPCAPDRKAAKDGYKTICEIGKERIRRAGDKIASEVAERRAKEATPLFDAADNGGGIPLPDIGFRVFKLDSTNIREWDTRPESTDLQRNIEESIEHLKLDRKAEDILYELLLKRGIELCVPIEQRECGGFTIYSVGAGTLFACLPEEEKSITSELAEAVASGIAAWHKELAPSGESVICFRDSAFKDDVAKTNLAAILNQHELREVHSL